MERAALPLPVRLMRIAPSWATVAVRRGLAFEPDLSEVAEIATEHDRIGLDLELQKNGPGDLAFRDVFEMATVSQKRSTGRG